MAPLLFSPVIHTVFMPFLCLSLESCMYRFKARLPGRQRERYRQVASNEIFEMIEIKLSKLGRLAITTAMGALVIGVIALICLSAHLDFAVPMSLFLLVVVIQSLWGGFTSAAIVSGCCGCISRLLFYSPSF